MDRRGRTYFTESYGEAGDSLILQGNKIRSGSQHQYARARPADHCCETLPAKGFHQLERTWHGRFPIALVQPVACGVLQQFRFGRHGVDQQSRPA